MVTEPFFISAFFKSFVLLFVLVFALTFAVLQKTNILGTDKKQVNALIALVVGMMLIAFPGPRDAILTMIPLMEVALVAILVFMMIYGFVMMIMI